MIPFISRKADIAVLYFLMAPKLQNSTLINGCAKLPFLQVPLAFLWCVADEAPWFNEWLGGDQSDFCSCLKHGWGFFSSTYQHGDT